MCSNNEQYEREALYYISRLTIPKGYQAESIVIREASGIAAGYNKAMQSSDAKYKVYLHQDTFIVEKNFIEKILKIFENAQIGMLGMVGTLKLPPNGVMWYAPCIGKIFVADADDTWCNEPGVVQGAYQTVETIDGLLMATQYDIRWREDIFQGWDFYDASQSKEFERNGYQVVVPAMESPWCIHDCGYNNLTNYWTERKKFLQEYGK